MRLASVTTYERCLIVTGWTLEMKPKAIGCSILKQAQWADHQKGHPLGFQNEAGQGLISIAFKY